MRTSETRSERRSMPCRPIWPISSPWPPSPPRAGARGHGGPSSGSRWTRGITSRAAEALGEPSRRRSCEGPASGLRTPTSRDLPRVAAPPRPEPAEPAEPQTPAPVIIRPRPNELFLQVRRKGADKSWLERRIDPSDSWWEKGALLSDGRGPALVDADGVRHPFPEAARGGFLVRAMKAPASQKSAAPSSKHLPTRPG